MLNRGDTCICATHIDYRIGNGDNRDGGGRVDYASAGIRPRRASS
jgi:hypothetical protein